jgi:chromosome segregation ATPase
MQSMSICQRTVVAIAAALVGASTGQCQTQSNDTLQSLLSEVHQLRLSIQAMTVASQRVQIALYQLQLQDAAVARVTQRLDATQSRCGSAESNRQHTAAAIQQFENVLSSATESQAKEIQPRLTELKSMLDTQAAEAQACQTTETEILGQLQNERVKLTELQERVDRLDKTLEKLSVAQ